MENILGASFSDPQWTQCTLPLSMGGMGLRSAHKHAPGAYIASISESSILVQEITGQDITLDTHSAHNMLALEDGDKGTLQEIMSMSQRQVTHKIDSQIHSSYFGHNGFMIN